MILAFLAAAATLAQPAPAPATHGDHANHAGHAGHAAPAPAAAATGRFSVETSQISAILANPAAKAIVDRHLPGFSTHPMIGQAGSLTLRAVQNFARGAIPDEKITAIQADFAALPAA